MSNISNNNWSSQRAVRYHLTETDGPGNVAEHSVLHTYQSVGQQDHDTWLGGYSGSSGNVERPAGFQETWTGIAAQDEEWASNGTDTDTESSVCENHYSPEYKQIADKPEEEALQILFGDYQRKKGAFRRLANKPVRKFRRYFRDTEGKGKGKSK